MFRARTGLLPLLALIAFLFTATAARADDAAPTIEERNKAVAMRVFEENFNQGHFAVADEIYAPDFQNHGLHGTLGLKVDQDAVHAEKLAFPDLRMSVEQLVAEGDYVTAVWVFRGTHTHDGYGGLPATGTPIEMEGITVWKIVDGKIRDEWSSFDELGAYLQVVAHVKAYLFAALIAFVAIVIALERGIAWAVRAAMMRVKARRT